MWEHYRKTFVGMQTTICVVTLGIYFYFGHMAGTALVFFVTMEVASVIGALWAQRLKGKLVTRTRELPLKPVK